MPPLTKVLFLGFCAGERELILRWAEAGLMPNIQALMARGVSGQSTSLPGFFVGSTWESFSTGVTPAKHGIHCWEQLRPGTYEIFRCYTGEHFKRRPFWDDLSEAGRRVAILDVPLSAPSAGLNGIQMVEWGAHDAQYGFLTSPPSLAKEVVARFGTHPWRGNCDGERDAHDFAAFRDGLVRGIATKADITVHYLRQGGWDLFVQVFTESHCVGHQCWHIHDRTHPWHTDELRRHVGDPVQDVYRAIDAAMGAILKEVDDETTVVFLAGHGMGPKYHAQFLLDQILLHLGVAVSPKSKPRIAPPPAPSLLQQTDLAVAALWRQLPEGFRQRLQPFRKQLRTWIDGPPVRPEPTIDPAESRCFMVSNNFAHGGIRINLIGREPHGIVSPGKECDEFCRDLANDLLEIVNLDTGRPVVQRVIRTADMYHGDHLNLLPDVLVEWAADAPVYAVGSPKVGEIRGEYRYCRSGEHRPGGVFIAAGSGIEPRRLDRSASILDFAPTLSALLGVTLPDTDGSMIQEVVDARQLTGRHPS